MSNIKLTFVMETLIFQNEMIVDILFRENEFAVQLSAPDGRILRREFERFIY